MYKLGVAQLTGTQPNIDLVYEAAISEAVPHLLYRIYRLSYFADG